MVDAPIITTDSKTLSPAARDEITRLGIKKVIILGDIPSVSLNVEAQVNALIGEDGVDRIAGANRFETAWAIWAVFADHWSDTAIVTTGNKFADALSIAPFAYATSSPIFLYNSTTNSFDSNTLAALTSGRFSHILLVGGDDAATLPDAAVRSQLGAMGAASACLRLAGTDRYLTSATVGDFSELFWAAAAGESRQTLTIAIGTNFPDALTGAVLAGKHHAPLYLAYDSPTGRAAIYQSAARSHYRGTLNQGYLFGSTAAVSQNIENTLSSLGVPSVSEQTVIDLTNAERAKNSLPALQMLPILQGAADIRTEEITYYWSHTRPDLREWDTAYREDLSGGSMSRLGENLAYGQRTPDAAVSDWMDSPGHRENILRPEFRYIGVGHLYHEGVSYWVQYFAG